jgi:prolyl 4-hydroxylase
MSDVAIGGSTVFLNLNVGVKPKMGAAVVWYNLDRSGVGDERTRHASCPVLIGSKWSE